MKHVSQLIEQFVSESLRVKAQFFEENKERIAYTAETIAQSLQEQPKETEDPTAGTVQRP